MKLWLDDVREPPDDSWVWVKTAEEALGHFRSGAVEEASLDHDLGGAPRALYNWMAPTGTMLAMQMEQECLFPSQVLVIHSSNRRGGNEMYWILNRLRENKQADFKMYYRPLPPA